MITAPAMSAAAIVTGFAAFKRTCLAWFPSLARFVCLFSARFVLTKFFPVFLEAIFFSSTPLKLFFESATKAEESVSAVLKKGFNCF